MMLIIFSKIIHIMSCHVISYLVLIFRIHDIVIMIIIRYMKPSTSTNNPSLYILNYSRPSTWNQQLIDSMFWQTVTHLVPILLSNPCGQIKQDAQYVSYLPNTYRISYSLIRLIKIKNDIEEQTKLQNTTQSVFIWDCPWKRLLMHFIEEETCPNLVSSHRLWMKWTITRLTVTAMCLMVNTMVETWKQFKKTNNLCFSQRPQDYHHENQQPVDYYHPFNDLDASEANDRHMTTFALFWRPF
jgi:hypothetical protein